MILVLRKRFWAGSYGIVRPGWRSDEEIARGNGQRRREIRLSFRSRLYFFMSPDLEPTNHPALDPSPSVEDMRAMRWQCGKCGHVMDFTRPVAIIVCGECPKCQGEAFSPA